MSRVLDVSVERLCGHHDAEGFDCGSPEHNKKLVYFRDAFIRGERVLGYVVLDRSHSVLAYIILSEEVFERWSSDEQVRCFTVPAVGVDKGVQGGRYFELLIEAAMNAMVVRQQGARVEGAPYGGLICMPGENKVLERWLRMHGFRSFRPSRDSGRDLGLYWLELDEYGEQA